MIGVVLRRIASSAVLLLVVSFVAHLLVLPGTDNVARNVLGEAASEDQVAAKAAELGLDQPFLVRYGDWLVSALSGDLGRSYFNPQSVMDAVLYRFPVTLWVIIFVTVSVGLLAFAAGLMAAVWRGVIDRGLQIIVTLGDALPSFVIGLFMVTIFAIEFGWFPATGYVPPEDSISGWLLTLALPVAALTITGVAGVAQHVRSAAITVMSSDYVRTRASRGLSSTYVLMTSVLRNAAPTGLSALAVQIITILGGGVVIEQVFALPGLGFLGVQAALRSDVPVVLGVLMTYVVIVIVVNFVVDLVVAWVNPKVRLGA
jgi:peptide/nickel transport system permease protein